MLFGSAARWIAQKETGFEDVRCGRTGIPAIEFLNGSWRPSARPRLRMDRQAVGDHRPAQLFPGLGVVLRGEPVGVVQAAGRDVELLRGVDALVGEGRAAGPGETSHGLATRCETNGVGSGPA